VRVTDCIIVSLLNISGSYHYNLLFICLLQHSIATPSQYYYYSYEQVAAAAWHGSLNWLFVVSHNTACTLRLPWAY
jgi:hypothetical protein